MTTLKASAAAKDMLGEKTRIMKEYEVKRRTLTEKGDKAKADQTKYEQGHQTARDEENDRHEKTMESLAEQYNGHIERAKNTQKEVKEQEDTLQLQFDEAIEQLTKHIQTTVGEDASQKQSEQAPAEEEEATEKEQEAKASITPEMIPLERVQKHLKLDLPATGATQEEIAASFFKLLNLTVQSTAASSSNNQADTMPSQQLALAGEGGKAAGKGSNDDNFTTIGKGGKPPKPLQAARKNKSPGRRARSHSPRR